VSAALCLRDAVAWRGTGHVAGRLNRSRGVARNGSDVTAGRHRFRWSGRHPLGSTELDPGGLSPGPLGSTTRTSPCGRNGTSGMATGMAGTAGSSPTFDGGGNIGVSGPCGSVAVGGTVSGTQSPSAVSGMTAGSTLGIGTIPLGATELGSAGISPMEPAPASAPTVNPSPSQTLNSSSAALSPSSSCAGAATTPGAFGSGTAMGTSGTSSPLSC
jgi:hypothetical protein